VRHPCLSTVAAVHFASVPAFPMNVQIQNKPTCLVVYY